MRAHPTAPPACRGRHPRPGAYWSSKRLPATQSKCASGLPPRPPLTTAPLPLAVFSPPPLTAVASPLARLSSPRSPRQTPAGRVVLPAVHHGLAPLAVFFAPAADRREMAAGSNCSSPPLTEAAKLLAVLLLPPLTGRSCR